LWAHFAPLRARRAELETHPDEADAILRRGAARAWGEASKVLARVRDAMGL